MAKSKSIGGRRYARDSEGQFATTSNGGGTAFENNIRNNLATAVSKHAVNEKAQAEAFRNLRTAADSGKSTTALSKKHSSAVAKSEKSAAAVEAADYKKRSNGVSSGIVKGPKVSKSGAGSDPKLARIERAKKAGVRASLVEVGNREIGKGRTGANVRLLKAASESASRAAGATGDLKTALLEDATMLKDLASSHPRPVIQVSNKIAK